MDRVVKPKQDIYWADFVIGKKDNNNKKIDRTTRKDVDTSPNQIPDIHDSSVVSVPIDVTREISEMLRAVIAQSV
jgi:hypothetical protein